MRPWIILFLLALFATVVAQEAPQEVPQEDNTAETRQDGETGESETQEPPEEEPVVEQEIDEEGLDEQGFEAEDEDDFRPTEEIPTDQSIPFPTDI